MICACRSIPPEPVQFRSVTRSKSSLWAAKESRGYRNESFISVRQSLLIERISSNRPARPHCYPQPNRGSTSVGYSNQAIRCNTELEFLGAPRLAEQEGLQTRDSAPSFQIHGQSNSLGAGRVSPLRYKHSARYYHPPR